MTLAYIRKREGRRKTEEKGELVGEGKEEEWKEGKWGEGERRRKGREGKGG